VWAAYPPSLAKAWVVYLPLGGIFLLYKNELTAASPWEALLALFKIKQLLCLPFHFIILESLRPSFHIKMYPLEWISVFYRCSQSTGAFCSLSSLLWHDRQSCMGRSPVHSSRCYKSSPLSAESTELCHMFLFLCRRGSVRLKKPQCGEAPEMPVGCSA